MLMCPKCENQMKKVEFARVEVDRCAVCGGLWFDATELSRLRVATGSEVIDAGGLKTGHAAERPARTMECPKDSATLVSRRDEDQEHIEYEQCPECRGVFFDAGEFKDLKELTIGERLSKWFTGSTAKKD